MADIADLRLKFSTSGEGQAVSALRSVDSEIKRVEQDSHGAGSALKNMFSTAGGFLLAGGVMGAIRSIKSGIGDIISAASDLNETTNKVDAVFGKKGGNQVVSWAQDAAQALGMTRQAAEEAVGTFGNLFQAQGFGNKAARDMSESLVGLAADLGSFNNVDPAQVIQDLTSAMLGEVEPARKYGIDVSDNAVQHEALAEGINKTTQEMSTQEKEQLRYNIIMKQTTTAQGDFAKTSNWLANGMRILHAHVLDMEAGLGKKLYPTITSGVNYLNGMFEQFDLMRRNGVDPFHAALDTLSDAIAAVFGYPVARAVDAFAEGIFNAGRMVIQFGRDLREAFGHGKKVSDLIKDFPQPLQRMATGFFTLADAVGRTYRQFESGGISKVISNLGSDLQEAVKGIGNVALGYYTAPIEIAIDVVKWAWGTIVQPLADWLDAAVGGTGTGNASDPMLKGLDTGVAGYHVPLGQVLVDVLQWAKGEIPDVWKWLKGEFGAGAPGDPMLAGLPDDGQHIPLGTVAIDAALKLFNDGQEWLGDLYGWFKGKLYGVASGVPVTGGAAALVTTAFASEPITFGDVAVDVALKLFNAGAEWAGNLWGWVKQQLGYGDMGTAPVGSAVSDLITGGAGGTTQSIPFGDIAVNVGKFIVHAAESVWDAVKRFGSGAAKLGKQAAIDLYGVAVNVYSWAKGEVADLWGWIQGQVAGVGAYDVASGTFGAADASGVSLSDVLVSVLSWAKNTIDDVTDDIGAWLKDEGVEVTFTAWKLNVGAPDTTPTVSFDVGAAIADAAFGGPGKTAADVKLPEGTDEKARSAGKSAGDKFAGWVSEGFQVAFGLGGGGGGGGGNNFATGIGELVIGFVQGIYQHISDALSGTDTQTFPGLSTEPGSHTAGLWENLVKVLTPDLSGIGLPDLPKWLTDNSLVNPILTLANDLGRAVTALQRIWDAWIALKDAIAGGAGSPGGNSAAQSGQTVTTMNPDVTVHPGYESSDYIGYGPVGSGGYGGMFGGDQTQPNRLTTPIKVPKPDFSAFTGGLAELATATQTNTNTVVDQFVQLRNNAQTLADATNNAVTNAFVAMRNNVASLMGSVVSVVSSALGGLAGMAGGEGYAIGDSLGSGIYNGIGAWATTIAAEAAAIVSVAILAARAAAGAHSPSRKMMQLGNDMMEGLLIPLHAGRPQVAGAMNNLLAFPAGGRSGTSRTAASAPVVQHIYQEGAFKGALISADFERRMEKVAESAADRKINSRRLGESR